MLGGELKKTAIDLCWSSSEYQPYTKYGLIAKEMFLYRLWQDMMMDWIQDSQGILKSLNILHWYVLVCQNVLLGID